MLQNMTQNEKRENEMNQTLFSSDLFRNILSSFDRIRPHIARCSNISSTSSKFISHALFHRMIQLLAFSQFLFVIICFNFIIEQLEPKFGKILQNHKIFIKFEMREKFYGLFFFKPVKILYNFSVLSHTFM